MSAPTTSWYVPPSSSSSLRCRPSSAAARAASPSCGTTWTPRRSPFDALRPCGRPAGSARSPSRRAGERDERRARASPTVASMPCSFAVVGERLVDPVGEPEQRELAQRRRGCPAGSSSRARRRSARPGRCCRAPCGAAAPPASCRRARSGRRARTTASGTVSRCLTPVICSTTSLSDSRCWMLTVEMTSIPASRSSSTSCQRFSLPRARDVRVRELVDERDLGPAREDGVEVHLLERRAAVVDRPARHDLEVADLLGRLRRGRASRRSRRRRRSPRSRAPPALVEHRVGLADAGRGAEVDPERRRAPWP